MSRKHLTFLLITQKSIKTIGFRHKKPSRIKNHKNNIKPKGIKNLIKIKNLAV
jgi:hypothetical protein